MVLPLVKGRFVKRVAATCFTITAAVWFACCCQAADTVRSGGEIQLENLGLSADAQIVSRVNEAGQLFYHTGDSIRVFDLNRRKDVRRVDAPQPQLGGRFLIRGATGVIFHDSEQVIEVPISETEKPTVLVRGMVGLSADAEWIARFDGTKKRILVTSRRDLLKPTAEVRCNVPKVSRLWVNPNGTRIVAKCRDDRVSQDGGETGTQMDLYVQPGDGAFLSFLNLWDESGTDLVDEHIRRLGLPEASVSDDLSVVCVSGTRKEDDQITGMVWIQRDDGKRRIRRLMRFPNHIVFASMCGGGEVLFVTLGDLAVSKESENVYRTIVYDTASGEELGFLSVNARITDFDRVNRQAYVVVPAGGARVTVPAPKGRS